LLYYAKLIPIELDDAARIDGASVIQLYLRIGQFLYRSLASPQPSAQSKQPELGDLRVDGKSRSQCRD
jgi:hypothetical protein